MLDIKYYAKESAIEDFRHSKAFPITEDMPMEERRERLTLAWNKRVVVMSYPLYWQNAF